MSHCACKISPASVQVRDCYFKISRGLNFLWTQQSPNPVAEFKGDMKERKEKKRCVQGMTRKKGKWYGRKETRLTR